MQWPGGGTSVRKGPPPEWTSAGCWIMNLATRSAGAQRKPSGCDGRNAGGGCAPVAEGGRSPRQRPNQRAAHRSPGSWKGALLGGVQAQSATSPIPAEAPGAPSVTAAGSSQAAPQVSTPVGRALGVAAYQVRDQESPSGSVHRPDWNRQARCALRSAVHEEASVKTGARRSRDFPHIHSAPRAVAERDEGACTFCSASMSLILLRVQSLRASVVHHRRAQPGSSMRRSIRPKRNTRLMNAGHEGANRAGFHPSRPGGERQSAGNGKSQRAVEGAGGDGRVEDALVRLCNLSWSGPIAEVKC
jgi:hypothetical protein